MAPNGGEVGSFAPSDVFARMRGRWLRVVVGAIVGAVCGYGISFLFAPTYASEVDLQVGAVHDRLVENTAVLAEHLESEGLRRAFEAELGYSLPLRAISVEVVGPGEAGASAYLRVIAKYGDPGHAQKIAQHLATFVEQRHALAFEQVSTDVAAYQAKLSEGLARLDVDVSAIQQRLAEVASPQNAIASLLLQSSLATARTQQIELRKQLRDSQIAQSLSTRRTRALGPASMPLNPEWPRRPVFGLLGAAAGFGLALSVALVPLVAAL